MTTQILRSAIAALAFTAMACGGGDPPGGGNGDTDGGGMTDNCDNVNLIEVIPGRWFVTQTNTPPQHLRGHGLRLPR